MKTIQTMRRRSFKQVDVFTQTPFAGNPVAVVLDAQDLKTEQMQVIARWTNLSETTFVLPPDDGADYRLRIFTPLRELSFAGHPTIGSAHAVLEAGLIKPGSNRLIQQCAAGLIELSIEQQAGRIWLRAPHASIAALDAGQTSLLERAFGLRCTTPPLRIDVGPVWITAQLEQASELLQADPNQQMLCELSAQLNATGITVFAPTGSADEAFEVRSFAPLHGIPEDPVCGSGNVCVAAYLSQHGRTDSYVARQGSAIGRDGRIFVRHQNQGIEIGGMAVTCVDGTLLA